jgi:methylation protein EvaC
LLKPDGLFVFEDPYLGDILATGAFDQFYDEHALYFSVTSVHNMLAVHGLELVAIEPQSVHGGSMRYTIAHAGSRARSPEVDQAMKRELEGGMTHRAAFDELRSRAARVRTELPELLARLRDSGKRVVGYAAT